MAERNNAAEYPDKTFEHNSISIKNLQLPFGIKAPDIWAKTKELPALVSVTLVLSQGFASAASKDTLDQNTVHYGLLAKRIRAGCTAEQSVPDVWRNIAAVVDDIGRREDGTFRLTLSTMKISLPKASIAGTGVSFSAVHNYDRHGQMTLSSIIFSIVEIKIMTLIGVNSYERTARQPLVANLELIMDAEIQLPDTQRVAAICKVEGILTEIIENSSFETLESLADFTLTELGRRCLRELVPQGSKIHLQLEKPRAIAFADCPVVEVFRDVSGHKQEVSKRSEGTANVKLNIIKPYA